MGTQTFDFLNDSFLFKDNLIADSFRTIPESEILNELNNYREFCLSNKSELEEEFLTNTSNFKMFSGLDMPDIKLLKQSAFYINQYIVDDPIFSFGYSSKNGFSKAISSSLGINEEPLNRDALIKIVSYVKNLTPMVAANYVKFLPISYSLEPPEQIPILHSENQFSDILPEPLIEFFKENVKVNSLERCPGYPQGINLKELQSGREILFRFKNHTSRSYGYILYETEFNSLNEEGNFEIRQYLPSEPPDKDNFVNWVNQSFYLSCKQIYDEVLYKNYIASEYKASYLSESEFVFNLLNQCFPLENTIPTNTANIFLNMELPFLDNVDISTLMTIRMNYGEEFQNFRLHLDKQFKELRLIKNPEDLKIKAENALHELAEVQIHAINQKIGQMKRTSALFDGLILPGSLLVAIHTGEWGIAGIAGLIAAAARGFKPFVDHSNQIKQNPAFFLWKVLSQSPQ